MSSGDFKNNTADEILKSTPEKPEGVEDPMLLNDSTDITDDYPEYADGVIPNVKHLSIKAGLYQDMLNNSDKFVNNELLWCVTFRSNVSWWY